MSSQTEEAVETTANVDELAKLSIEQLESLRDDHAKAGNDTAATALQTLIDERKRVEEKLAEQDAKKAKPPAKSRKGSRAPKGRQIIAAQSFNQDPENLARLKRILEGDPNHDPPIEPVIQADGTYRMTPWLVQLGISGYYDERRRETKAGTTPPEPAPIIPPAATEAAGESAPSDTSQTETPAASAPVVEAPAAPAVEADPGAEAQSTEVTGTVEQTEATTPPMPINPYGTDGDDE